MPVGSKLPEFSLLPEGSGDDYFWERRSWLLAGGIASLIFIGFLIFVSLAGCPMEKKVEFVVLAPESFRSLFCDQLKHLQWLKPELVIRIRFEGTDTGCENGIGLATSGADPNIERIFVERLTGSG